MRDCLAPELADRGDGFLGGGEVAIGDEDICAFFGESNRGGASDSAGAAGDECVFVFESESHRNSVAIKKDKR